MSKFNLSTSKGRHNLIVGALAIVLIPGLLFAIYFVVQREANLNEATELTEKGLTDLGENRLEEGITKLELAESKHSNIVWDRTDSSSFSTQSDVTHLSDDQQVVRLKGIKVLKSYEDWVDRDIKRILLKQGKYAEAEAIKPARVKLWFEDKNVVGIGDGDPADLERAKELWKSNKRAEAIKQLNRAVELFPWNTATREFANEVCEKVPNPKIQLTLKNNSLTEDDVSTLQGDGAEGREENAHKNDIAKLDSVLKQYPNCAMALLLREQHYYELEDYKRALADANLLVKLHPDLPESYYLRAEVYEQQSKEQEAFNDFSAGLKLQPDSFDLREGLVRKARELEKHDIIPGEYDKLIAVATNPETSVEDKSGYFEGRGMLAEAEKVLDAYLPKAEVQKRIDKLMLRNNYLNAPDPTSELKRRKAALRAKQKDFKGAVAIMDDLIKERPDRLANYDLKSDFLMQANDKQAALDVINQAIEKQGSPFEISGTNFAAIGRDLPDKLPSGSYAKDGAFERMDRRATIYSAIGNHAAATEQRRFKLKAMILELEAGHEYRFSELMELAESLNDAPSAVRSIALFKKATESEPGYEGVTLIAEQLAERGDTTFGAPVVQEIANNYKGDKRILDALEKLKRQSKK